MLKKYEALFPRELLGGSDDLSLNSLLRAHASRFGRMHMSFISRVDQILSSQAPAQAVKELGALLAEGERSLGQSPIDVAVLNGLDIAHSSAQYWSGGRRQPAASNDWQMQAKWWHVVAADVAGGIVGGIFGGGVGAVGLGAACSKAVASL